MKSTALMSVLLVAASVAYAQTQPQPVPPLALVSDTRVTVQDSPLVQAAKRAAEKRRNSPSKSMGVITDATVTKSNVVLTTSSGSADIPDFTLKNYPAAPPASASPSARAAAPATMRTTDEYSALAAAYPRLPQPSQNTGATLRTAENGGYLPSAAAPSAALPRAQSPTTVTSPRTATNASAGPSQSTNAGPNRPPSP